MMKVRIKETQFCWNSMMTWYLVEKVRVREEEVEGKGEREKEGW